MSQPSVREIATFVNANGVRVAQFEMLPNASGPWHRHSQVSEHCFCLKGRIVVESAGKPVVHLGPGERCEIPVGVSHRLRNGGDQDCGYLVVQGIGAYDFVESESET